MIATIINANAPGKRNTHFAVGINPWRLLLLLAALLLFAAPPLRAQEQQTVTGTVHDEQNKPLVNASVLISGTKKGTVTNEKGQFTITAARGNTLVISNVGFTTQRIKIDNKTNYSISLSPANSNLNDVVVVGLQRQSRRNTVASISGITAKDIQ